MKKDKCLNDVTKIIQFSRIPIFSLSNNHKSSLKLNSCSKLDKVPHFRNREFFEQENFWNLSFDKGRIKTLVSWFLKNYGQKKTIQLVENLKNIGFEYATKAGISLGIDDLKISPNKASLIAEAEKQTYEVITQYKRAQITGVERFQRLIDTWHRTSENLKQEVINYFEITDLLNPVYMMAFSGARGNISQVRQLVGMRGLMADPKGQILDFPIRSNFREGLTLTEYLISSYGARKGIVDTALRTANAGYLTRRLVDVAQHVIVSHYDCGTHKGILIGDMKEGNKIIYSLQNRLIGRVLAQNVYSGNDLIAVRNQELSSEIAGKISKVVSKVLIRSALTCETRKLICQLCYGWSLGQGKLVSIGDAVGVIAAQSIGEPGTQLTMRTFHTGGVFSSDVNDQIMGPYDGLIQYSGYIPGTLVRTPQGKIAFLTKAEGSFIIKSLMTGVSVTDQKTKFFKIPPYTLLFCRHNEKVYFKQVVAQMCSSSTQNKQRDDAEQSIQTELQGQVYMDRVTLIEQTNQYADTNQQSWDWGYIWILSGKIYEIPVDSYIFPKFGDFITQNSVLNQIQWMVPDQSDFNIRVQDNTSYNFNLKSKLPNKKNKKLLKNVTNFIPFDIKVESTNHVKKNEIDVKLMKKEEQTNILKFKVVKEKFTNIIFSDSTLKKSFLATQLHPFKLKFKDKTMNKFNSENEDRNYALDTNMSSIRPELTFKRPLLLLDTTKFSYKKLGYFFKVTLPLSISKIYSQNRFIDPNFVNLNDKFFIPVNFHVQNKLFQTNIIRNGDDTPSLFEHRNLDNSFDWKLFSQTFLTWFPTRFEKQGSGLIRYEIYKTSGFNMSGDDYQSLVLKQKNPIFYSRLINNITELPFRNLNYNQIIYNNIKDTTLSSKSKHLMKSSIFDSNHNLKFKKLWFFSGNTHRQIKQKQFLNVSSNQNINSLPLLWKHEPNSSFKKYTELRWKNSKTLQNNDVFYRGRIFYIPNQIYQFVGFEADSVSTLFNTTTNFNNSYFNSQMNNSVLYYNLTRQGKKLPIYLNSDGLVKIYQKSIFDSGLNKRSTFAENFSIVNLTRSSKNSLFANNKSKKLFQSIKNYNKQYYIGLKFKAEKIKTNPITVNEISLCNTSKNYKKLLFLKTCYLNKNFSSQKYERIKDQFFINNQLTFRNIFNFKKIKNISTLNTNFKFSFLNLNPSLEKELIFNKVKRKLTSLILQIQSGWLYIPSTFTTNIIKYHKSLVPLGKLIIDDIMFDNQLVYVECLTIKSSVLRYNMNFLNKLSYLDHNLVSLFQETDVYNVIKKRHEFRRNIRFINKTDCLYKNTEILFNNLKWVSNSKRINTIKQFTNLLFEKKSLTTLPLNLPYSNINSLETSFILIIKKVNEFNIQNLSDYKTTLYNSQITNFQAHFSLLLKNNYHTSLFNKQAKNLKLISKFPNVDFYCQPIVKLPSRLKLQNQSLLILGKKGFKSNLVLKPKSQVGTTSKSELKLSSNTQFNNNKFICYKKISSLLYFKLHFTNNSTFKMYYKQPIFSFNYLTNPNFSTFFASDFNMMYKSIFQDGMQSTNDYSEICKNVIFETLDSKDSNQFCHFSKMTLLFSSQLSKLFAKPLFDFSVGQNPSYFFNNRFFVKTELTQKFAKVNSQNLGLSVSLKKFVYSSVHLFPNIKNSYIFKTQDKVLAMEPFAYSSFLSPYEGELLFKEKNTWNTTFQKNRLLILTKNDLISYNLKPLFLPSALTLASDNDLLDSTLIKQDTSIHNDIFIKLQNKVYKIDNLLLMEPTVKNVFLIGEFIYYGDQMNDNIGLSQAGQVIHLSRTKLTIRKGQSIFLSSNAILHAYNGDLIDKNFPVVTLPYQKLKAGDIVQGIPKIEQFFEARITRRGRLFRDSIPNLLKGLFKRYKLKYPLVKAVQQSFYKIQQILVDGVQRVYRSQGVTIADKHIEIIVKQMTCKVKIINGGQTGFFPGELVDLEFVEQINKVLMNKVYYEPVVLGITKASLEVESFLSAASFQQTTRMLSKAAISRKKDFLKGLKENVIVGNLIPSGTGYLVYLQDTNKNFKI